MILASDLKLVVGFLTHWECERVLIERCADQDIEVITVRIFQVIFDLNSCDDFGSDYHDERDSGRVYLRCQLNVCGNFLEE
jgi:hypothetical protein